MRTYISLKGRQNTVKRSRYFDPKTALDDNRKSIVLDVDNGIIPETHGSYAGLILHPKWKSKRKEIIERDNHRCIICSSKKGLQVHHRQYHFIYATKKFKVPWDYDNSLLITLCSKCHSRGHSKFKVPSLII